MSLVLLFMGSRMECHSLHYSSVLGEFRGLPYTPMYPYIPSLFQFMDVTSLLLGGATTDGPGHMVVSTCTLSTLLSHHPPSAFLLKTKTRAALHNGLAQGKAQPEAFALYKVEHNSVQGSACS